MGSEPVTGGSPYPAEIFTGMLLFDGFTVYFRSVLLIFAVLFLVMTRLSGIPDSEDGADFYTLILGATLGMCIMASANHLLMIFLGVEMASVPSYALAGILKGAGRAAKRRLNIRFRRGYRRRDALRYQPAGRLRLGSAHLPTIVAQLATMPAGAFADRQMVLMLGGLMLAVGLAFKLSAVPFHFWCPDVFEGASAEVDAFLSVASKAAAMALLIRVGIGFGQAFRSPPRRSAQQAPQAQVHLVAAKANAVADEHAANDAVEKAEVQASTVLEHSRDYIVGADRFPGRDHLHVRQPGRLCTDEYQTAVRLFDDRACRLHDDAGGGGGRLIGRDPAMAEQSVAALCLLRRRVLCS